MPTFNVKSAAMRYPGCVYVLNGEITGDRICMVKDVDTIPDMLAQQEAIYLRNNPGMVAVVFMPGRVPFVTLALVDGAVVRREPTSEEVAALVEPV